MRFDDEAGRRAWPSLGRVALAARSLDAPREHGRIKHLGIVVMDRVVSLVAGRPVQTTPQAGRGSPSSAEPETTLSTSLSTMMPKGAPPGPPSAPVSPRPSMSPSLMRPLSTPSTGTPTTAHPPRPCDHSELSPSHRYAVPDASRERLLLVARDPAWGFVSWKLSEEARPRDEATIRLRIVESSTGVVVVSEVLQFEALSEGRRYFRLPASRHPLVAYIEQVTAMDGRTIERLRSSMVLAASAGPERPSPTPTFIGAEHLRCLLAQRAQAGGGRRSASNACVAPPNRAAEAEAEATGSTFRSAAAVPLSPRAREARRLIEARAGTDPQMGACASAGDAGHSGPMPNILAPTLSTRAPATEQASLLVEPASAPVGEVSAHVDGASSRAQPASAYVSEVSAPVGEVSAHVDGASSRAQPASAYVGEVRPHVGEVSAHIDGASSRAQPASAYVCEVSAYVCEVSAYVGEVSAYVGEVSAHVGEVSAHVGEVSAHVGEVSARVDGATPSALGAGGGLPSSHTVASDTFGRRGPHA
ncbi:MAG: hypothetical protein IPK13_04365 [Deltaproteobacteria bacterium]|nr:hypothetical protein [Deltaproteobacteria bacterium]